MQAEVTVNIDRLKNVSTSLEVPYLYTGLLKLVKQFSGSDMRTDGCINRYGEADRHLFLQLFDANAPKSRKADPPLTKNR
jgi:hypothetical protein